MNIRLPFEAEPNPVIAEDPKLINFKYFFTRKLMFIKEASAFVLLPGGFGTMDEAFELLTLIQTGQERHAPDRSARRSRRDATGKQFVDFVQRDLVERGYVSAPDLKLFTRHRRRRRAADESRGSTRTTTRCGSSDSGSSCGCSDVPDDATLARLSRGLRATSSRRARSSAAMPQPVRGRGRRRARHASASPALRPRVVRPPPRADRRTQSAAYRCRQRG